MWKKKLEEILDFSESNAGLLSNKIRNKEFIDKHNNFIIFGAGSAGAKTKEFLDELGKNVAYFVDNDINKKGREFLGKIVKHPSEILMFEYKVIIASTWWRDIKKQIEEEFGLIFKLDFDISHCIFNLSKMEIDNTQGKFLSYLKSNLDEYIRAFDFLEDEISKVLYFRVLKARIFYGETLFYPPMPKVNYKQYFHPLVKPEDGDIIVDAGAYIGDTIEEIVKQNINYKRIYAFEPDEQNYAKLIENTKKYNNIECYNFGLWSKTDKLYFIANGTGVSTVTQNSNEANQTIDVVSLDEFFQDKEKPTLIKMDIEGAEAEALYGAREIITKYKPKLQICIYHKPEHLWQIPILLKDWVKEYKLYIGHHEFNFAETVLYAKV